jgi:hypothetical protein
LIQADKKVGLRKIRAAVFGRYLEQPPAVIQRPLAMRCLLGLGHGFRRILSLCEY